MKLSLKVSEYIFEYNAHERTWRMHACNQIQSKQLDPDTENSTTETKYLYSPKSILLGILSQFLKCYIWNKKSNHV